MGLISAVFSQCLHEMIYKYLFYAVPAQLPTAPASAGAIKSDWFDLKQKK